MTLSEVLDGAFSICRAHFGELVEIVAVVLVPVQLVALVALLGRTRIESVDAPARHQ